MQNSERALTDIAEQVLMKKKDPMDIYTLFDQVADIKGYTDEEKDQHITQFYSDITISGRFIYVGNNEWDLKEHQKIELWDKDGSFYKEYTEIKLPKEEKEEKAVKPKPKPEPKPEPEIDKTIDVQPKDEGADVTPEPVEEAETIKTEPLPPLEDISVEEEEEEYVEDDLFEDIEDDDFDEEKYNEYMDVYEDRYDD